MSIHFKRFDTTFISTAKSDSTLTFTPITIYYKPIPFLDIPTVHEEISYRQKDLSLLGPFHPSLGLVPLEATISRQIYSSRLHDLLRKFSTIALEFLEPPTTTAIPDADKRIDAFRERWHYILHDVYLPAERAWLERIVLPSPLVPPPPYPTTDTLDQWYKEVIPDQLVDDALEEWNETALYAQIMRMLMHCHDCWLKFGGQWVIDIEYEEELEEYGKKLRAFIANQKNPKPSLRLKPNDLQMMERGDQPTDKWNRFLKYALAKSTSNSYQLPENLSTFTPVSPFTLPALSQSNCSISAPSTPSVNDSDCKVLATTSLSNHSFNSFTSSFSLTTSKTSDTFSSSDASSSHQSTYLTPSPSPPSKLSVIKEVIVNGLESNWKKLNLINRTEEEETIDIQEEKNSVQEPLLSGIIIKSDSKEVEPGTLIHRRKFDFDKQEEVLKKYV